MAEIKGIFLQICLFCYIAKLVVANVVCCNNLDITAGPRSIIFAEVVVTFNESRICRNRQLALVISGPQVCLGTIYFPWHCKALGSSKGNANAFHHFAVISFRECMVIITINNMRYLYRVFNASICWAVSQFKRSLFHCLNSLV
ncbi:hypothetical protein C5958_17725 [Cronobacter sakazakii]|nr:hypothetical protein C5958_17725 [Cronobacter sakazakii]